METSKEHDAKYKLILDMLDDTIETYLIHAQAAVSIDETFCDHSTYFLELSKKKRKEVEDMIRGLVYAI